jgi:leucyl-tRNA synthetase
MRFTIELPVDMPGPEVEKQVLAHEVAQKWLEGKAPKKVIVVPKKIVNVVV